MNQNVATTNRLIRELNTIQMNTNNNNALDSANSQLSEEFMNTEKKFVDNAYMNNDNRPKKVFYQNSAYSNNTNGK